MSAGFRHSSGFGRRMEYWLIGLMLKEGLDVYVPLVDDFGIDAIVRKQTGDFIEVQIKARSDSVIPGDAALFAAIVHPKVRKNYYFIFYAERLEKMWIMSSEEFVLMAAQNKSGKNVGKRSIWLNGKRKNLQTGQVIEYPLPRFEPYLAADFSRFRTAGALIVDRSGLNVSSEES